MGSGAPVSQSIPVSQQALGDVGVSAQTAAAPSSAVTLSPPGLGRSDIQIPVLEYGRTQPVWQEGFSQLSHQLEPPSHAVVMKPWDEVPVIPKNVCVWHRGVQGITQLVECAAGGAVTWLLYGLQISASSPPK